MVTKHKTGSVSNRLLPRGGLYSGRRYLKENYDLYLFILPAFVLIFIFSYIPLYGAILAFKDFSVSKGFFGSAWVGFKHFEKFFSSAYMPLLIRNTLVISLYSLLAGFPFPIILALLLNSVPSKRFRKLVQTSTYAPYFISTIVMCGMILLFLSPRAGIINNMIFALGGERTNFMANPAAFSHIYVWSSIWQGSGWQSVIYIAALTSISPELHESAMIDGAGKFKRMWYIDLPGLIPTACVLFIMSFGGLMSLGMEKALPLQNNQNLTASEILSTYVYKVGLKDNNPSFSTAVNVFSSAVNLILLTGINATFRKFSKNSLW